MTHYPSPRRAGGHAWRAPRLRCGGAAGPAPRRSLSLSCLWKGGAVMVMHWIKVKEHEHGLLFRDGVFERLLAPGRHFVFEPFLRVKVEIASVRQGRFAHPYPRVTVRSGHL